MPATSSTPSVPNLFFRIVKWAVGLLALVFLAGLVSGVYDSYVNDTRHAGKVNGAVELASDKEATITTDEAAIVAHPQSKITGLQREAALKSYTGKTVVWKLEVNDVLRDGKSFLVSASSGGLFSNLGRTTYELNTVLSMVAASKADIATIEALKAGDFITIKGRFKAVTDSYVHLDPVILFNPVAVSAEPVTPRAVFVSTAEKILTPEDTAAINETARNIAHDKAQEANVQALQAQGVLGNVQVNTVDSYANRFNSDCFASKQRDAIMMGGMGVADAATLARSICAAALPSFSACIAKPGTKYLACYSGALPSAE